MAMRAPTNEYLILVKQFPLRPIKTEKENEVALAFFRKVRSVGEDRLTSGASDYLYVLGRLIGDFESSHYSFGKKQLPGELLEYLMNEHNLTQMDLASDLGGQATVSLLISGKRDFTKSHIEKLSKRFNVSPALFF